MPGILLMIANYFHDLSVAILASNILVVFFLGRYLDRHGARETFIPDLFRKLARVTYYALAYVIVFGAVRAYFFMDFEWNPAVGRGQTAALVVKHVILVAVTVFGVIAHLRYHKRYAVPKA